MARLQILELPEGSGDDRPPFILIFDQLGEDDLENLAIGDQVERLREQTGARAILAYPGTLDIPANDTTAYLSAGLDVDEPRAPADEGLRLAHERTGIARDMDRLASRRDELADALGIDRTSNWDDIRNTAAEFRAELIRSENARERLRQDRDEARSWARHGYETGQKHCGWTDHGVAPDWLTEGWPAQFDSCEHLKRAAEYDEAIGRVRELHQPVEYRGQAICRECSAYAGSSTDNAPVAHDQCSTLRALLGNTERSPEE